MSEISKAYEPQAVEEKWYQFWLDQKCFVADPKSPKPAFSIVIPPPNVTGVLHMGHVLNNTIQDILSRKARMDGKEVLWLPGTDHAGIATQVQVEKALKKEERKTKHDLGREEFLKRVWAWKEKHGGIIIQQLKKLGCSCDWTRERFTMDPEYSRCVQKVFVDLYKKGLIYRGKRMVNWCPATQTALSDEEVEMKPQKGFMYHFKVQVVGEPNTWLTIATTRPETIPGDTAVAVNPKDKRYAHLIGKQAIRPLPIQLPQEKKLIPIIGDEHVDFEFGTGVLKVTPAHDKADFEIGQRHKLPVVDIMNPNGTMNELAGDSLSGLDRFEARKVAVERLKELAALVDQKPYENNVGYSQRADVPIESRLSEQWFLKYPAVEQSKACVEQAGSANQPEGLAEISPGQRPGSVDGKGLHPEGVPGGSAAPAGAGALRGPEPRMLSGANIQKPSGLCDSGSDHKMHFYPQRWAKVYDHWLANIQDWCISRQLWWGHRIPVWTIKVPNEKIAQAVAKVFGDEKMKHHTVIRLEGDVMYIATSEPEVEASLNADPHFTQDPDVLDTWFSSWLWPFATMGWTNDKAIDARNETLKKFYPTTDLVTAPEIIFFWVARMIMAGFEYMGELPFRNVYFTGIVRDKQGRKMSKQLGNSPNPLDLIAQYGADAIRFGTMRSAPLGQDVMFDENDVELGRNFCNKLWNACRFRQMVGSADIPVQGEINPKLLTSDDKWILLKLDLAIREITDALNSYNFSIAVHALYRFFWNEYCDWYVEASKAVLWDSNRGNEAPGEQSTIDNRQSPIDNARQANTLAVIDFVLSHTLRLFHPFLPFITEELWHGMGYAEDMPEGQGGKTIMFAHWPKPFDEDFKGHYGLDDCYLDMANAKYDLVTQGRNLRRAGNIQAAKKVKYVFKPAQHLTTHDAEVIKLLLNAESLEIDPNYQPPKGTPSVKTQLGEMLLPLEGHIDRDAEIARLKKEMEKIQAEIVKVEQKLANPNFTQKVPPQVLQEHQQRLADWQAKLAHVRNALDALNG